MSICDNGKSPCEVLCFVERASLYNLVNKFNLVNSFPQYIYFFSLYVSDDYVPIIRRNNCIYSTLGTCHSVWMTGMQGAYQTVIHTACHSVWLTGMQGAYQTVIHTE